MVSLTETLKSPAQIPKYTKIQNTTIQKYKWNVEGKWIIYLTYLLYDFNEVERVLFLTVCPSTFIKSNEICFQAYVSQLLLLVVSRQSFVFRGLPLDLYKVERDLLSSLYLSTFIKSTEFFFRGLPLDLYKVEQVLLSSLCRSTFSKSNEFFSF